MALRLFLRELDLHAAFFREKDLQKSLMEERNAHRLDKALCSQQLGEEKAEKAQLTQKLKAAENEREEAWATLAVQEARITALEADLKVRQDTVIDRPTSEVQGDGLLTFLAWARGLGKLGLA